MVRPLSSPGASVTEVQMIKVLTCREAFVAVARKAGKGEVVEFRPRSEYLKSILDQPVLKLGALCQDCSQMAEEKLFSVRRISL